MIYDEYCELLHEVGWARASRIIFNQLDINRMQPFTLSERKLVAFKSQIRFASASIESILDSFDIKNFERKLLRACDWSVDLDDWESNIGNFTADEFLVFFCVHEARESQFKYSWASKFSREKLNDFFVAARYETDLTIGHYWATELTVIKFLTEAFASNSETFVSLVIEATRVYESSLRDTDSNRRLGNKHFYGLPVFLEENSENVYGVMEFTLQGDPSCRVCGHNAGGAWKRCPKCFCSERCSRCKNFCEPVLPGSDYARLLERLCSPNLRIRRSLCDECLREKLVKLEPEYDETDLGPAMFLIKQSALRNQTWNAIEHIFKRFDEDYFVSTFSSGTPDQILLWFELQVQFEPEDRGENPTRFQTDFDEVTTTTKVLEEIKLPVNLVNLRRYCNLSAEQVLNLIDSGIDVDKAAPLMRQGISVDDLPLGLQISAFGLDSSTCQLLITNGIETRHLTIFKERPKLLKNAVGILKVGVKISGADKLLEWAEIDLDPRDISKWIRSGCNAQVTQSWMSNGFDWREAKAWIKSAGVKDPTIAARRRSAGISP